MILTLDELGLRKQAYTINEIISDGPVKRTALYEAIEQGHLRTTKAGARTIALAPDYAKFLNYLRRSTPRRIGKDKQPRQRLAANDTA
jgi:hypothetical protein